MSRRRTQPVVRGLAVLSLLAYAVVLVMVTLTPVPLSRDVAPPNWVPFADIYRLITRTPGGVYESVEQLAGNVALYVPLGWLLPAIWSGLRSVAKVVGLAALISLVIELLQLSFVEGRWTSIDDVILNSCGALIGAVMFFAPLSLHGDDDGGLGASSPRP